MKPHRVPKPRSNSLLDQLDSLNQTFKNIVGNVNFDFSELDFIYPLLILPIASFIQDTDSKFSYSIYDYVNSYLQTIAFPHGVSSVLEDQRLKTYIPIGVLKKEKPQEYGNLQDVFVEKISNVLSPDVRGAKDGIYYPIGEFVDNIFEHSERSEGYVFAQYYQYMEFVDLCIVDRGRGLATAYKEELGDYFRDDEAIKRALEGYSTKKEGRGYGIKSSKRIICEELNGEFVLISGNAAMYSSKTKDSIDNYDFYWNGVIVAYRIPKPVKIVNIYPYLEG